MPAAKTFCISVSLPDGIVICDASTTWPVGVNAFARNSGLNRLVLPTVFALINAFCSTVRGSVLPTTGVPDANLAVDVAVGVGVGVGGFCNKRYASAACGSVMLAGNPCEPYPRA